MLVLTRKIEQTIVIGGNITVAVLKIEGDRFIKLGFTAPDDVDITREELLGSGGGMPHKLHEKHEGMLVLSREVEEAVVISKNIVVRILGLERGRVKVGVKAPDDVKVLRGELLDETRVHGSKERF